MVVDEDAAVDGRSRVNLCTVKCLNFEGSADRQHMSALGICLEVHCDCRFAAPMAFALQAALRLSDPFR